MKKMNSITAVLLLLCTTVTMAFAGSPGLGYQPGLTKTFKVELPHRTSVVFTKNKKFNAAPNMLQYDEGRCGKYKKMQVVGFVLVGCGAGTLTTGVVLLALATSNAYNNGNDINTVGLVGGGAFCLVAGIGMTAAGIPLSIIGSVKRKKYCASSFDYRITPTGTGINLACRF